MSRVFWDSNLFIYLFEDFKANSHRVAELRKRMLIRGDQLFTSTLTLGEILVKPIESKDAVLQHKYESALKQSAVLIPFDTAAATTYAALRTDRTLRPPDAIQLACAACAHVDLFITNDARLGKKRVDGIQFIVSLESAFL